MSSLAAIRAGAGYATVAVPADLEPIFEAAAARGDVGRLPGRRRAPGAGRPKAVLARLRARRGRRARAGHGPRRGLAGAGPRGRSPRIEAPLVIDADGLNAFAGELDLLAARPAPTILTPHAGELGAPARARLGGDRRPPARRRPRGRRLRAAPSSCSRATTRSSPTASGSRSTRSRRPALATAGTRRRPLGHHRGAARPRPGAVRRRLRRGDRPRPRRAARPPRRIGAAESVIATDVIDSIPAGLRPGEPVE